MRVCVCVGVCCFAVQDVISSLSICVLMLVHVRCFLKLLNWLKTDFHSHFEYSCSHFLYCCLCLLWRIDASVPKASLYHFSLRASSSKLCFGTVRLPGAQRGRHLPASIRNLCFCVIYVRVCYNLSGFGILGGRRPVTLLNITRRSH